MRFIFAHASFASDEWYVDVDIASRSDSLTYTAQPFTTLDGIERRLATPIASTQYHPVTVQWLRSIRSDVRCAIARVQRSQYRVTFAIQAPLFFILWNASQDVSFKVQACSQRRSSLTSPLRVSALIVLDPHTR